MVFREMGKEGELSIKGIDAALGALATEDIFGGIIQQLLNLPERALPPLMELLRAQTGSMAGAMAALAPSYTATTGMQGKIELEIKFKDVEGNIIDDMEVAVDRVSGPVSISGGGG